MDGYTNAAEWAASILTAAAIALTNQPPSDIKRAPSLAPFSTLIRPPIPSLRAIAAVPQPVTLLLTVGYPAEDITTDTAFRIWTCTNIVTPTWEVLTNLLSGRTNCLTQVIPAKRYYSTSVYSQFWGAESSFGPVTSTPTFPQGTATTGIQKP